jgi:hypothetical protein
MTIFTIAGPVVPYFLQPSPRAQSRGLLEQIPRLHPGFIGIAYAGMTRHRINRDRTPAAIPSFVSCDGLPSYLQRQIVKRPALNRYRSMSPPTIIVVVIASHFWLSWIIPTMPYTRAAGNENIMSNPPRTARGLPQPGLLRSAIQNVAPATPSRTADIFPKRIFQFSR